MTFQEYLNHVREAHRRMLEELMRIEMEFLKSMGVGVEPIPPLTTTMPIATP